MDLPAFSIQENESVGAEHLSTSSRRLASFAFNDEGFGIEHTISHPQNGPAYDEEPPDKNDFEDQPKREHSYRTILPGEITPYLGLRARLTQIPINRWTILILLVLARMCILFDGLNTNFTSAQQEATSACSKVEDIGSTLASMPHYLSLGVNELIADNITNIVRALIGILMMIITSVANIINFVIDFELGTMGCLFDVLIEAILDLAGAAVQDVCNLANKLIHPVMANIKNIVDPAIQTIDGIENGVSSIAGFFGAKTDLPDLTKVDTELTKLENFSVGPDQVLKGIKDLESSLNFSTVIADIKFVVDLPFDIITTLLNESYGNWTMNSSLFTIANKETLTFCTGNAMLTDFFNVLFTIAKNAKIIASVGLCILATLAAVTMAWWEVQRYQRSVVKSETLRDREPMDVIYVAGRPLTAGAGLWVSKKVSKDPKRQMLIRWCMAYATTYTALFVLSLAVAGLFSALCQYFIMRAIQKEAPGLATEVGDFVSQVVGTLEGSSQNWANESNSAMLALQNDINDHVFGWAKTATDTIGNVIDKFVSSTNDEMHKVFGDSALYRFVDGLVNCTIVNKLEEVKDGLEWVHDHAQVTFPEFPPNVFSMGLINTTGSNSTLASIVASSGNSTAHEITGAVTKIIATLKSNIITEGLIALVLLLIYATYVVLAAAQSALRMCIIRDHRDEPRRNMDASESQRGSDEDEPRQRYKIGTQRQMPRRESIALSIFSEFDIAEALDENKPGPISPVVEAVAGSRSPAAANNEATARDVHAGVESVASDDVDEDPFSDNAFPAEGMENFADGDATFVQVLRGSRDIVDGDENGRSLTMHRGYSWTGDRGI